jgi:hypothetical protein
LSNRLCGSNLHDAGTDTDMEPLQRVVHQQMGRWLSVCAVEGEAAFTLFSRSFPPRFPVELADVFLSSLSLLIRAHPSSLKSTIAMSQKPPPRAVLAAQTSPNGAGAHARSFPLFIAFPPMNFPALFPPPTPHFPQSRKCGPRALDQASPPEQLRDRPRRRFAPVAW